MGNEFTRALGIKTPLICGAMYPCSNPELVAAVSEAGGIGIVQPLSLTYVHGYDFRQGLRYIRTLTRKPIGVNLIIEQSSKKYLKRVHEWLDIALEENVGFFVTALGDPRWVVDQAKPSGAIIYHDVTEKRFGQKAFDAGVDGFICVNNRAGGHAGNLSPEQLLEDLAPMGKPMICAGGIGSPATFANAIARGYVGAQLGTRFIASTECSAQNKYKLAILAAQEKDIVLTDKITGIPVSVINTPHIERSGTHAGTLAKWLLRGRKTKRWMRTFYSLQSVWKLKKAAVQGMNHKDYFQAGKSIGEINKVCSVENIVRAYKAALV